MHFGILAFALLPFSCAAPVPVPGSGAVAAQSDAAAAQSKTAVAKLAAARNEVVAGLEDASSALFNITLNAAGTSASLTKLAESTNADVERAEKGVAVISKNLNEGVDPNTGNNPQGQVVSAILAAQKSAKEIAGTKGGNREALTQLQSGLSSAIKGAKGVLAAQGKSLSSVIEPDGQPLPARAVNAKAGAGSTAAAAKGGAKS